MKPRLSGTGSHSVGSGLKVNFLVRIEIAEASLLLLERCGSVGTNEKVSSDDTRLRDMVMLDGLDTEPSRGEGRRG